ncbi:DUF177 domain-containing protein [Ammoniphilus sp. YIM 78166]|uniref:YceD family protein n=1 Tax=Ammoniphilus sp. YIM 78166 TaxID=1644106 RepID=UPI00106FA6A0|nr:DUF177 domain-containing protein [Ammoniphilus sp. YIM 78166]
MIIHVNELEKAPGRMLALQSAVTTDQLRQPGISFENFQFAGQARKEGEIVFVEGTLTGELKSKCAKCIAPTFYAFTHSFDEGFTEGEIDEEESDLNPYQAGKIDLEPFFHQDILLHMPQVFICEDDCKGLCPSCGVNRNEQPCECVNERIDPRLADLAMFFNQDKESK